MAVQSHTNIDIINWHFSLIDDDESYQEAGFLKLGNEMTFKSSQGAKLKPSHRPKSSPILLRMPGFNLGVKNMLKYQNTYLLAACLSSTRFVVVENSHLIQSKSKIMFLIILT